MKETITVTQADIDAAQKNCPLRTKFCPIARAVRRHKSWKRWRVSLRDIYSLNIDTKDIPLPKRAVTFIDRFDNGMSVKPFSFTIEVPGDEPM